MEERTAELHLRLIMKPAIIATYLTKTYRSRGNRNIISGIWRPEWQLKEAVQNISFSVESGESIAFLGPNGAGKTTTTKMMTGLIAPTSGSVQVMGFDPFSRNPNYLQQIGLVMGNRAGLNWDLTAKQSFWLLQNIYNIPQKTHDLRVKELTEMLGVANHLNQQVRRLSLGERMKLELIGAILHQPKILFLDEPTIGLDITAKKTIRAFLRKVQQQDKITLILTSHDMDDIEHVCDRVIIINHGQKIYDDALETLLHQHKTHRYVRFEFDHSTPLKELKQYGEILQSNNSSALLQIDSSKMVRSISEIANRFHIDDMRIESVPLEEIIEDLYLSDTKQLTKQ